MAETEITPAPTPEEAAAIMAAHEALWPKPVVVDTTPERRSSSWRFSGRWWAGPIPVRRSRPWM